MINETNIACMCPECENINIFKVNIFSFSGEREKIYKCKCGGSEISLKKNSNKSFSVEFMCPVCKEEHSFVVPSNQFWSDDVFAFPCPFYEATSLFIGRGEKLEKAIKEYIKDELSVENPEEYNDYPMVEKILTIISDINANTDKYRFCSCQSEYSTAYNENSLYIICDKCGYSQRIDYEDLR